MGSYPVAVANKFSKGDIYSTTEKVIGQWTDGKPLYQKVLTGTFQASGTSSSVDIGASVDTIVSQRAFFTKSSEGWTQELFISTDDFSKFGKIQAYNNSAESSLRNKVFINTNASNWVGLPVTIILKYTKTTDSSTPMGDENDYSTSEKIVGTWIDGKPLYQKTFQPSMPQCATNGTGVSGTFSIGATVNEIVKISIKFRSGSGYDMTQESFREGGDGILTSTSSLPTTIYYKGVRCYGAPNSVSTSSDRNKIFLINSSIDMNTYTPVVTVQYTKTT